MGIRGSVKPLEYLIRASFAQERMAYLPEESKLIYESKDGAKAKVLDTLQWLAAMGSSLPLPSTRTRVTRWIPMGADGAVNRIGKMS